MFMTVCDSVFVLFAVLARPSCWFWQHFCAVGLLLVIGIGRPLFRSAIARHRDSKDDLFFINPSKRFEQMIRATKFMTLQDLVPWLWLRIQLFIQPTPYDCFRYFTPSSLYQQLSHSASKCVTVMQYALTPLKHLSCKKCSYWTAYHSLIAKSPKPAFVLRGLVQFTSMWWGSV